MCVCLSLLNATSRIIDILTAKTCGGNAQKQLLEAAKAGAARELWEETGINVQSQLHRLQPAALKSSNTATELSCEIKHRLFFFLAVTDEDFLSSDKTSEQLVGPLGTEGRHLKIKYSVEHSGFDFERDPNVSVQKLKKHSGGIPSQALAMAMARDAHKSKSKSVSAGADPTTPPVLLGDDRTRSKKEERNCFSCFC